MLRLYKDLLNDKMWTNIIHDQIQQRPNNYCTMFVLRSRKWGVGKKPYLGVLIFFRNQI
jgi:hypothetical protein